MKKTPIALRLVYCFTGIISRHSIPLRLPLRADGGSVLFFVDSLATDKRRIPKENESRTARNTRFPHRQKQNRGYVAFKWDQEGEWHHLTFVLWKIFILFYSS